MTKRNSFAQDLADSTDRVVGGIHAAALGQEFDDAGGEDQLGISRREYVGMFANRPALLDGLGRRDSDETPAMAALGQEFDHAGGEERLGITRKEYVGMFADWVR